MTIDELYDAALGAIEELFSDKSVSKEECITNLQTLIEEIELMIESLED